MSKSAKRALTIAAALSPLAVIPASFPIAVWTALEDRQDSNEAVWTLLWTNLKALLVLNLFAVPTAYALMILIGVPAALFAIWARRTPLLGALVVGGVAGAALSLFLEGGNAETKPLAMMIWMGLVVGAVFWTLFKRLRGKANDGFVVAA
jgi:hypothetical protein